LHQIIHEGGLAFDARALIGLIGLIGLIVCSSDVRYCN